MQIGMAQIVCHIVDKRRYATYPAFDLAFTKEFNGHLFR